MPPHATQPSCPRCGYDQSGEVATWTDRCPVSGTCPECGAGFKWSDTYIDPFRPPSWSFEHASGWRWWTRIPTVAARCVLPPLYWRSMRFASPLRWGRLLAAWLIWCLAVRVAVSLVLGPWAASLGMTQTGAIGLIPYFRDFSFSWFFRHVAYALLGSAGPPLLGSWSDMEDMWTCLMLALIPFQTATCWMVAMIACRGRYIELNAAAKHAARALMMSAGMLPVAYEVMRLLATVAIGSAGWVDPFVLMLLWTGVVWFWIFLWWVSAARMIEPLKGPIPILGLVVASLLITFVLFGTTLTVIGVLL